MQFSLYDISVTPVSRGFATLRHLVKRARQHCEEHDIEESTLIGARLYEDMFSFGEQIVAASAFALNSLLPMAGKPDQLPGVRPSTLDEFDAWIEQSIAILDTLNASDFTEDGPVTTRMPALTFDFPDRRSILMEWLLPNFYFHVSTAYDILRHNGVKIGKADYLLRTSAKMTQLDG